MHSMPHSGGGDILFIWPLFLAAGAVFVGWVASAAALTAAAAAVQKVAKETQTTPLRVLAVVVIGGLILLAMVS